MLATTKTQHGVKAGGDVSLGATQTAVSEVTSVPAYNIAVTLPVTPIALFANSGLGAHTAR